MRTKIFLLLSSIFYLSCMEDKQLTTFELLHRLPEDIQAIILCDKTHVRQSLKTLISLSRTNKYWHAAIKKNKNFSIQKLAQKLEITPRAIVLHLVNLKELDANWEQKYPADSTLDDEILAACRQKNYDLLKSLISRNANVNVSAQWTTPLLVSFTQPDMIRSLLNAHSLVSSPEKTIKLLLNFGADPNVMPSEKLNVLQYAKLFQMTTTEEKLLKDHGAQDVVIKNDPDKYEIISRRVNK